MAVAAETHPLSAEAAFALEYAASIDPQGVVADQEQNDVVGMAEALTDIDERLMVLGGLYERLHNPDNSSAVLRAIEAGEDLKYGNGLLEVTSLDDALKAGERVLGGKNPAMIIRASVWGDKIDKVGDEIPSLFAPLGDFAKVGVQQFPQPSMKAGSSGLHLDNFIYDRNGDSGFRYSMSAAQLKDGKVLFMAGFPGKRAMDIRPKQEGVVHQYEQALLRLEEDPKVKYQYASAKAGRPKSQTEFTTVEDRTMVSVVLNPGDVVIWPQGGPGAEAPAWHAFRKIGDEERASTSYHYMQASA
jgi:hypothetical protein